MNEEQRAAESEQWSARTRGEKKITRAARDAGYTVTFLYYDNDRTSYEMAGDGSGWYGDMVRDSDGRPEDICGHNVHETIADIQRIAETPPQEEYEVLG